MQQRLKYIVFTFFILLLSHISNAGALYIMDKYINYIYTCEPDATNCSPQNAKDMKPNSVAVSPTGRYLIISSELNNLYVCGISPDDEKISCVYYTTDYAFSDPQGMAYGPIEKFMNQYIYVTNKGNNSIDVCQIKEIIFYKRYSLSCKKAGIGFIAPNNIAISRDGRYAYITQPEVSSVAICPIQEDYTFGACNNYSQPYVYPKPVAVAVDKPGKFLYIMDGALAFNGISCPLINGGSAIGACNSYQVISDSAPTAIEMPTQYYVESASDAFAYVSSQNQLYFCLIPNGVYNCNPIYSLFFNYISSLSFTYK